MHDGRTRKVETVDPGPDPVFLERHRASVTVLGGVGAGTEFALEGARTTAGRSPKAEIRLDDSSVSLEHATFELDAHGFGIRDLASTNGVRVNGDEVLSAPLAHGDRIRLGDCELQYVVEDRAAAPKSWSVEADD